MAYFLNLIFVIASFLAAIQGKDNSSRENSFCPLDGGACSIQTATADTPPRTELDTEDAEIEAEFTSEPFMDYSESEFLVETEQQDEEVDETLLNDDDENGDDNDDDDDDSEDSSSTEKTDL